MKVSLNWIKEYVDIDISLDELVQKIGIQLGAVEQIIDLKSKYQGIVLVQVKSCEPHPNADKLHICKIDDGGKVKEITRDSDGLVQVVCGAPNVKAGLRAAWLPPGSTVPSTAGNDPLVLETREIRGEVSNGMLASPAELGISDYHGGIVELDWEESKPGDDFAAAVGLDDYIIDIENKMFTHRPDCFGQLGVAREIAGITHKPFQSPATYLTARDNARDGKLSVTIKNELPKLVPRFMAQIVEDVTVGPSPIWLQAYLTRVGVRPINNIVDVTNYHMLLTGQPMHAYDYDKVKALSQGEASIVIRGPKDGEELALLNGKTIKLLPGDIVIATDKQAIGLGGIMGGAETEVDSNTKNIILEAANFDMYACRRSSMEHGLFTDAVTRFTKGQSAWQCQPVLSWGSGDIANVGNGQLGRVYDLKEALPKPAVVKVSADFINDRLGSSLEASAMAELLTNVEFDVTVGGDELTITTPFWRTDIEIPEDIVEEIGRLHGYDRLPVELPERSMSAARRDEDLDFRAELRNALAAAGANEVLTYSFIHGNLLQKTGQPAEEAYQLSNALSPDLQYFRMSLMPSLLDKVHPNLKAGFDSFALFEMNKTHNLPYTAQTKAELPAEMPLLAVVVAASDKADHPAGAPFYQARKYLMTVAARLGLSPVFSPIETEPDFPITRPYDYARSAMVTDANTGTYLGIIGEFKTSVRRGLKLPNYVAGFELGLDDLRKAAADRSPYRQISRFPAAEQDICLRVPAEVIYHQLESVVIDALAAHKPENSQAKMTALDIFRRDNDDHKQITWRISLASYQKTLTNKEISTLLDAIAATAGDKLGAERI